MVLALPPAISSLRPEAFVSKVGIVSGAGLGALLVRPTALVQAPVTGTSDVPKKCWGRGEPVSTSSEKLLAR